MFIKNSVVFITGSNRGLGEEFAREAIKRGASKVYASSRDPSKVKIPGVIPVQLDVNDLSSITEAVKLAQDVTLLINNAGITDTTKLLSDSGEEAIKKLLETNLFGPLRMAKAFANILEKNGGGAIINVLSAASWIGNKYVPAYAISKSAAWSLTNGLRKEFSEQKTKILGLHSGYIDTDMSQRLTEHKSTKNHVVCSAYDGLEYNKDEVLADDYTMYVHEGFNNQIPIYLKELS